jgi:hypothetical protein
VLGAVDELTWDCAAPAVRAPLPAGAAPAEPSEPALLEELPDPASLEEADRPWPWLPLLRGSADGELPAPPCDALDWPASEPVDPELPWA